MGTPSQPKGTIAMGPIDGAQNAVCSAGDTYAHTTLAMAWCTNWAFKPMLYYDICRCATAASTTRDRKSVV